jgi:hypothetical protein
VIPKVDLRQLQFAESALLWFLLVPAILLVVWVWRVTQRRADTRRLMRARIVPVRERFAFVGDLPCWFSDRRTRLRRSRSRQAAAPPRLSGRAGRP